MNLLAKIFPGTFFSKNEVCKEKKLTKTTSQIATKQHKYIKILASNITSLSDAAMQKLFSPEWIQTYSVYLLAEIHKPTKFVQKQFGKHGFSAKYNPPRPLSLGDHGGELVATKSNINSCGVCQFLLEGIADKSGQPFP